MPKWVERRWPGHFTLATAGVFLCLLWFLLRKDMWEGAGLGILLGVLAVIQYSVDRALERSQFQYILSLGRRVGDTASYAFDHMPFGIVLYDEEGKIVWHNAFLLELYKEEQKEAYLGEQIAEVFPGWHTATKRILLRLGERLCQLEHDAKQRLVMIQDVTQVERWKKRCTDEQTALGFVYIDNYDEAGQDLPDQERSVLLSTVVGVISTWAQENDLVLKSIDRDRMFFICQQRSLQRLMASRFSILDQVRDTTSAHRIPITLSIGIACTGTTLLECSQDAKTALELALARGGDQVAMQVGQKMRFYGGQSDAVEKQTRVRARTVAHGIVNWVRKSKRVIIMGHAGPDLDSLGACLGVARLVALHDRTARIVGGPASPAVEPLMAMVQKHPELMEQFIDPAEALEWAAQEETLLILVDTHRPSLSLAPEVLAASKRVVVIDHHRRGEEFVRDPLLVYLESSASSACELVAELLHYQGNRLSLHPLEATALLAGIVVDTRHFSLRAGSRTFEAASFLRRHGGDPMVVQSLLEEDWNHYVKRAALVRSARFVRHDIVIAVAQEEERYDQLLLAQAADTLLAMQGVEASFVIARRPDSVVALSARSRGRYNVQILMEKMGGGGHLTQAACQLLDTTPQRANATLVTLLKEQLSEIKGGAEDQ